MKVIYTFAIGLIFFVNAAAQPTKEPPSISDVFGNMLEETLATGVGYYSGQELFLLGPKDRFFYAYVTGVYDSDKTSKPFGAPYCVPIGVTNGQLADVVYQFFEKNPAIRQRNAAHLVRVALRSVYPCPAKQ